MSLNRTLAVVTVSEYLNRGDEAGRRAFVATLLSDEDRAAILKAIHAEHAALINRSWAVNAREQLEWQR